MNFDALDILEGIPVGVVVADLKGNIRIMNPCAKLCLESATDSTEHIRIQDWFEDHNINASGCLPNIPDGKDKVFKTIRKNGRVFETATVSLNNSEGLPQGLTIIIKDITEAENNRELAIKKEKYAALEEFSADIAHEIRNPLGSIELYASLLKKELKRKKDVNRVNQIMAAAKIVENKISSLILLSKNFDIPTKPVNLHTILKDILLFSEQIIDEESVFLSVKYADCEPVVDCNQDMIKQVFLNLILNALQAMPEKSRLDIETKYAPEHHSIDIYFIENASDEIDDMPSRIFDRFSRTNEKSSHLGLAIVHNIVNMYNGSLKIEFLEGIGTAFVLSFPIVNRQSV
jgi:signal transduction histidine kinase